MREFRTFQRKITIGSSDTYTMPVDRERGYKVEIDSALGGAQVDVLSELGNLLFSTGGTDPHFGGYIMPGDIITFVVTGHTIDFNIIVDKYVHK